jgi:aerotaxis receptor
MTPVNREEPLVTHELVFSTTDPKGVITSGNDVLVRVSRHPLDELLGAPHHIIRHPEMPRAVFATMWEHLGRRQPIAAYIKNMSATGTYYWVMALVVPLADGFLSVQMKPSTPMLTAAQRIYGDIRATERHVEGGDVRRRKESIAAGVQRLHTLLAAAGHADYAAFMHAALSAEVAARRERGDSLTQGRTPASGDLGTAAAASHDAAVTLQRMVADLERYEQVAIGLRQQSQSVFDLAEDIELFALNAVVSAARLGGRGAALGAVADILGRRSSESEGDIRALYDHLCATADQLSGMRFQVAGSMLMAEMVRVFLEGIRDAGTDAAARQIELRSLSEALTSVTDGTIAALDAFADSVDHVEGDVQRVDTHLKTVHALEINGRIEGARLNDGVVIDLFKSIADQIDQARARLRGFDTLRQAAGTPEARREARASLATVKRAAGLVGALPEAESRAA